VSPQQKIADALDRSYAFIGEHIDRNVLPVDPQNLDREQFFGFEVVLK
jgi:hypothetical protein